jgi:predicted nucleic acid-binding protein
LTAPQELEFGARKAPRTLGTTHFVDRVDQLKRVFDVDPIGPEFSEPYARVRDTIITAHGLSLGAVVVSRNLREFERVPWLKVEDWETTEAGG